MILKIIFTIRFDRIAFQDNLFQSQKRNCLVQSGLDKTFVRCYLINMNIEDIRKVAVPACREFNVSLLDAFGSAARGSATSSSDVDREYFRL